MKVFWSWQSDTPGKTGRHFVRDAIQAAIEELKTPPDVEEPTLAFDRESIHLDHDRKGVAGSPDLAATIFAKIDAAAVVIADVTPIGVGPARKDNDGKEVPPKALMNPNVAIELGYSLGKPGAAGGNRLLMIYNTHYGTRADLPFDLAHKAGPIFYTLPPDATRATIEAEGKKLRRELVTTLRPFLTAAEAAASPAFVPMPPGVNAGVWFQAGAVLGRSGDTRFGDVVTDHVISVSPVFYLRLIPSKPIPRPLTRTELRQLAHHLPFFSMTGGMYVLENEWGAANVEPYGSGEPISSIAQLFLNGEVWAINRILVSRFRDDELFSYAAMETILKSVLPSYLDVMAREVGVVLPVTAEIGFIGVRSYRMLLGDHESVGPVHADPKPVRALLNAATPAARDTLLLRLFEQMFFELVQERRPENFRGFPERAQ